MRSSGLAERGAPGRWRVTLREPVHVDGETVDPWLGEAIAAVGGRVADEAAVVHLGDMLATLGESQRLLLITPAGGSPCGIIVLSSAGHDLVMIDALAVAAADRNLGWGAEAVYELEEQYPGARLIAGVPLTNGLAIYFWLRIGYRPIFPRSDAGGLAPNRVWMVRGEPEGALPQS